MTNPDDYLVGDVPVANNVPLQNLSRRAASSTTAKDKYHNSSCGEVRLLPIGEGHRYRGYAYELWDTQPCTNDTAHSPDSHHSGSESLLVTSGTSAVDVFTNKTFVRSAFRATTKQYDHFVTGNDRKRVALFTAIERAGSFWEYVQAKCPPNTTCIKFAVRLGRLLFGNPFYKAESRAPGELGAYLNAEYVKARAGFKFKRESAAEMAALQLVVEARRSIPHGMGLRRGGYEYEG